MTLKDLATYERSRAGKIYPPKSFGIQISATRGQMEWFEDGGEIEAKYAVVMTDPDKIVPKFLYFYIRDTLPAFLHYAQTGLNIQIDVIGDIPITFPLPRHGKRRRGKGRWRGQW